MPQAATVKTPTSPTTADFARAQPTRLPRSLTGGPRSTGFTLLEMMVVITIMALVVGLAPLAYQRLQASSEYRSTVRAITADMRAARNRAQLEGVDQRFVVNLDERSFGLAGGPLHHVPDALSFSAIMAGQESSAKRSLAIRFLPQGGASGGSVDIVRPSGAGVRLRVDWFSGRVEQELIQP